MSNKTRFYAEFTRVAGRDKSCHADMAAARRAVVEAAHLDPIGTSFEGKREVSWEELRSCAKKGIRTSWW